MDESQHPLVTVVGPTGSGKSELALDLAEHFSGEIVNCDSLQIYRYLDIGTAKVPAAERRSVPHHLMDVVDPNCIFTAGEYARKARQALRDITSRRALPIVAGGTGFYLRALLEGLFPGPERDDRLRARLARRETRHPGWLHGLLAAFDSQAADRIQARDVQKLIRAVEILLLTRKPASEWFGEQGRDPLGGYRVLKLGLDPPRDALYQRLDSRCAAMFTEGLLDEVRQVLALGFPSDSKALGAHGYRQAVQVILGKMQLSDAVMLAQRNTRHYAKRQWTWFRRDPEVRWLQGFGDDTEVRQEALRLTHKFINDGGAAQK